MMKKKRKKKNKRLLVCKSKLQIKRNRIVTKSIRKLKILYMLKVIAKQQKQRKSHKLLKP